MGLSAAQAMKNKRNDSKQIKKKKTNINQLHFLHQTLENEAADFVNREGVWPVTSPRVRMTSGRFKMLGDKVSRVYLKGEFTPKRSGLPFALLILSQRKSLRLRIKSQHFRLVVTKKNISTQTDTGGASETKKLGRLAAQQTRWPPEI